MTSTSSYVLPEAPGSDGVDGGGEPSAIISPEELEARVDVDELLGLPWITRFVFGMFGLALWGGDLKNCEKARHTLCSLIIFLHMGCAFFSLFHTIFGYNKEVCYVIAAFVFVSNMFQVPAERFKFTDPLLVPYLSKNAESLKQKVHFASWCIFGFFFYMLWAGLPTVGFAATQAFAPYEIKMSKNNGTNAMNRTGEESEVEVTALGPDMILGYFLLFTSPLCWMIMTGWFPAEGIYMNYDKQVTELWISEYADDVLRTLVDDRVPPKERLERLSMLYQRRGKWLSQSLANHINPFHTYAFPVHTFNFLLCIVLLFPGAFGGSIMSTMLFSRTLLSE